MGKYDDLSKEQLTNLLVKRDAQARLGLVWERDEIQRDCALNDKFVAMDLVRDECRGQGPWRNLVIGGENFDALRWLRMTMSGRARLIYLDPPYNTGNKDWVYNDKYVNKTDQYRHSTWLEWMHVRLELARDLLAPDGAIFASIDDNEGAHLRLLMDQVFGPDRFVASFIWQKVDSPNDNKPVIAADHEFIHCYASKATVARWQKMPDAGVLNGFSMRDEQDRLYRDRILRKNGKSSLRTDRETMWFDLDAPDGTKVWPIRDDGLEGRWSHGKDGVKRLKSEGRFIWKQVTRPDGTLSWVPYAREYAKEEPSRPYPTIWTDVETTRQSKAHHKEMFPGQEPFVTPKPEPLMARIIQLATEEGDLVVDLFLGSGTTAAVATKMGRRWIGVESIAEVRAQAIKRLDAVRAGEPGGVSAATEWEGTDDGFAVLRPTLIRMEDLAYDLKREQVWLAVQVLAGVPLVPYRDGEALQVVQTAEVTLAYCDRPTPDALAELVRLAGAGRALSVYAYTPGAVRDVLAGREAVEILPLPDVLLRAFTS